MRSIPFHQLEAILFDLDGTLINTDDAAVARLARRLKPLLGRRAHRTARWVTMKSETPGNALITLLDLVNLDEPLMGLTDKLRRRRGVYPAPEFSLIPGVSDLMLGLNGRYRSALVTTRSRYHIERFLERFPEETAVFGASCGLQDTRRLKPHPSPVQLAAKRLDVPVEKCLMVGDTTVDVKAARRAGAWSIGVLCGFGEREELERAGAHLILDSTADLRKLLEKP
jgi:phosphoglycolate phosphatase